MTSPMTVVAITVFVVAYVLIASDRINKTMVALCGAAVVVALGIVDNDGAFFSRETGHRLGRHLPVVRDDGHRLGPPPDRRLRVHRDMGCKARQGISAANHDPAGPRHRVCILASGQCDDGSADRTSDLVGVRQARYPCGAISDRRGLRLQHRRCGHAGRRPAEHHHREPGRVVVQRLSRPHAADRRHRAGRVRADAAAIVPWLVRGRRRTGWPT